MDVTPPAAPVPETNEATPPATSTLTAPATTAPPSDLGEYKVWNPPKSSTTNAASTLDSLPDSYFEPTAEELKRAFQQQSRLVQNLNNAPLKTEAIRQREAKERESRWPETRIRIRFPNQLQLEKKFSSSEKIKAIYAFARSALTEEAKSHKFVLFQAPRRELKNSDPDVKTKSLVQLGLAPATVLHFSFLDESLNSTTAPPPLLPEILARATDLPPPPSLEPPSSKDDKNKPRTLGGSGSGSASGSTPGVPKWLKLGKK